MTKEQILAAITQAVQEGTIADVDTGFVTTLKTINGKGLKFFFGTQAEYETLTAAEKSSLFAIITNDTSREAFLTAVEELQNRAESLEIRTGNVESIAADLTERTAMLESRTEDILPFQIVTFGAALQGNSWYFGFITTSDGIFNISLFYWRDAIEAKFPAAYPFTLKVNRDGTYKAMKTGVDSSFGDYEEEASNASITLYKLEYFSEV